MMQAGRTLLKGAIFMVAALALSACSMFRGDDRPAASPAPTTTPAAAAVSLFGGGGGSGGGGDAKPASA